MITFSVKGLRKNCEVPSCVTITYFSGGSKLEYKILLIALFMKFCYDFGVHFWEITMSNFHATFKIKFSDLIYIHLDTKITAKCQKKNNSKNFVLPYSLNWNMVWWHKRALHIFFLDLCMKMLSFYVEIIITFYVGYNLVIKKLSEKSKKKSPIYSPLLIIHTYSCQTNKQQQQQQQQHWYPRNMDESRQQHVIAKNTGKDKFQFKNSIKLNDIYRVSWKMESVLIHE